MAPNSEATKGDFKDKQFAETEVADKVVEQCEFEVVDDSLVKREWNGTTREEGYSAKRCSSRDVKMLVMPWNCAHCFWGIVDCVSHRITLDFQIYQTSSSQTQSHPIVR